MTLRLILIRHAKSSWDDPFGDDHARVLNKRGRASAEAVGAWLAKQGHIPDIALCSDAARTQETAELILPALAPQPKLHLSGRIYHAAPATILDMIAQQTAPTVAVIGHNPGIGMLANALVKTPPAHPRFSDYPTCAVTVMEFDLESWGDVKAKTGQCQDFVVPRDLIGASSYDIE